MFEKIRLKIHSSTTPLTIVTAIIFYLVSIAVLDWSDARLTAIAPEFLKPDLNFGYGYADIMLALTLLGESGRSAYLTNLIIDTIMPVLFAAATILVVVRAASRWWIILSIPPITFMVLDIIENTAFGLMLLQYPEVSPGLVALTSPVTMVKLSSFFIALPTLIIGSIYLIFQWMRTRISTPRTTSLPGS
jgi:hypothetical protein